MTDRAHCILVTGGAGFIGSNFIEYILETDQECIVINVDKLTYAGSLGNLDGVLDHPRHHFIKEDICNRDVLHSLFQKYDITGVIHFAAESHVDNSIASPESFVISNVLGTNTVLDAARQHWMSAPFVHRTGYENCKFVHISTDEVYGSLGATGTFTEESPYAPRSPYSASKAGSDMLVSSYHHTYGMNVNITHCSNNYGPRQHAEKLIPTIIKNALALKEIPLYGDGRNVRDWIYVLDHCRAVDAVYRKGQPGSTYNIGARVELTNLDITEIICDLLELISPIGSTSPIQRYRDLITYVNDRPGHDRRYSIDPSKIQSEFGWEAQENLETGLLKTVRWYLDNQSVLIG